MRALRCFVAAFKGSGCSGFSAFSARTMTFCSFGETA